jgi:hypothetical protein
MHICVDVRFGLTHGVDRKVSKVMFSTAAKLCPNMISFYGKLPAHAYINDQGLGKRLLVFGLPHSGTSLFSFFLAQRPNAVAFINVYPGTEVPTPKELGLGVDTSSSSSTATLTGGTWSSNVTSARLSTGASVRNIIQLMQNSKNSHVESPDVIMRLPFPPPLATTTLPTPPAAINGGGGGPGRSFMQLSVQERSSRPCVQNNEESPICPVAIKV